MTDAVCEALLPLPHVLAGWESRSIAFDRLDEFSDIDLNFLLTDEARDDALYEIVETALARVSPIVVEHAEPPGRYYKLAEGAEFLLVDVCIFRAASLNERLDTARHGNVRPLFDKGQWLQRDAHDRVLQRASIAKRQEHLGSWFSVSQAFVRKAIARGHEAEAMAAFWGYTLKPLVELLRMKHCPARWDFGMRYLDRDLPVPVYAELLGLLFVGAASDLPERHATGVAWEERLLEEAVPRQSWRRRRA